ncbi:hypothetical protein N7468_001154 [Penicillium chermesinum]|uniref:DUF7702 domain-containing protein n=1 Tax=Penicillium chermesinum TaxID=63820 RepID=A0A9W9TWB3_9EURO|nr:uncharacterized protein N7468_001154 [Penicillium chermesinum]KAJ5246171.1 hypothetical protein N7468_001154 [Penicillium chermesinum]
MVSTTGSYEIANITFFGACLLPTLFFLGTGGRFGIGCWLNALLAICFRISGHALSYQALSTPKGFNTIGIVLNGIGMSPLTLAVGAMLSNANTSIKPRLPLPAKALGTLVSTILMVVGNSFSLAGMKNHPLLIAGVWMEFAAWVIICGMTITVWMHKENNNRRPEEMQVRRFLTDCGLDCAPIDRRSCYLFPNHRIEGGEYAFITGGGVAYEAFLGTLPEFLTMLSLLTGGLLTWQLGSKRRAERKAKKHGDEAEGLVYKGEDDDHEDTMYHGASMYRDPYTHPMDRTDNVSDVSV